MAPFWTATTRSRRRLLFDTALFRVSRTALSFALTGFFVLGSRPLFQKLQSSEWWKFVVSLNGTSSLAYCPPWKKMNSIFHRTPNILLYFLLRNKVKLPLFPASCCNSKIFFFQKGKLIILSECTVTGKVRLHIFVCLLKSFNRLTIQPANLKMRLGMKACWWLDGTIMRCKLKDCSLREHVKD